MSEQAKHTPNEWYAVRHEHTLPESKKDCYRIDIRGNPMKVNGKTVASEPICTLHAGFVHFEGNAALILAAPKLFEFKQYVHGRLDAAGVSVDPESPHKPEGCRIGGRLDELIGERDRLRDQLARLTQAAETCLGGWTNVKCRDALREELNAIAAKKQAA